MTKNIYPLTAIVATFCALGSEAYIQHTHTKSAMTSSRTSALNALPPMLIGGTIRKMKEKEEEKKRPMCSPEEAKAEAPGLRVGKQVWKWPPVWPYDADFFKPNEDVASGPNPNMSQMSSVLTGITQMPTPDELETPEKKELDVFEYWGELQKDVETQLDEDAIEKLKSHYEYYLKDGMSVLEFGAAEKSYLPDDLKLSRHVGVSLSESLMKKNPSLTETMVVNLNDVVEDRDVNSDELRELAAEPFDAIIMANTVDFLTNPREVFRSAWYLLKPGGLMIVPFSGKDNASYRTKFERASTTMWRQYTDDQHMWICGSFFEFSASGGWEKLYGFDISPESAQDMDSNILSKVVKGGKSNNLYVVQASKVMETDVGISLDNLENSIESKMWMLPIVEPRDKALIVPRLARAITVTDKKDETITTVEANLATIPALYEALVRMDQFTFTFSYQAQLAADLITNPLFRASDEQMLALRQGLGLRTPSPEFWEPVGTLTSSMSVEDKIDLLAYVVPCFDNPEKEQALEDFVQGLKPTFSFIKTRCPELSDSDVQMIGTELLACEFLGFEGCSRPDFASWLGAMTTEELKAPLERRRALRQQADDEKAAYIEAEEEKKRLLEEQKKLYQEQLQQARENRSMIINVRTGKLEKYEVKK